MPPPDSRQTAQDDKTKMRSATTIPTSTVYPTTAAAASQARRTFTGPGQDAGYSSRIWYRRVRFTPAASAIFAAGALRYP
jgi:hypothetical protein